MAGSKSVTPPAGASGLIDTVVLAAAFVVLLEPLEPDAVI
jgi:hypothetical protein